MNSERDEIGLEILIDKDQSITQNKHWRMLRNIFRAACLLRRYDAEPVNDVSLLVRSVEKIPTDKVYRSIKEKEKFKDSLNQAVKEYRMQQSVFQIVEKGNSEDLPNLMKILQNDPKRYLRDPKSQNFLLNIKNSAGLTPLIISAKNGNLEFVKFLLENGADWQARSLFDKENALEVASRWGHDKIVKELMRKEWSQKEIRSAHRRASSQEVRSVLKPKSKKRCWFCSNDLFLFFVITYSAINILFQWDSFEYSPHRTCKQPIHYWLMIALVSILIYHIGTIYLTPVEEEYDENEIIRINIFRAGYKVYSIITVGIVYPVFLSWTLLGTVWYIENTNDPSQLVNTNSTSKSEATKKCFDTEDTMSWYFLTWIISFYVIIVIATTIISYAAILHYKERAFEMQYESLLQQYGEDERPRMNFSLYGLSPLQIVETSSVVNVQEYTGECPICIEEFKEGEKARVLRCGHKYHLPCIDIWLMQHSSCPLCKADFNRGIENK